MRLCYLGTPELAVGPLRALVEAGHEVVLVVSRRDARRGRGSALVPSPVKQAALELGLEVTDQVDAVASCGAELGVVVAYGRLVPESVLDVVPMVNLHFSLLPRWRGAAPVERAILAGDAVTGVALMALEAGLDTGGIYDLATVEVGDASLETLRGQLVDLGTQLLLRRLEGGLAGLGTPVPQEGEVTYAHKIEPAELLLDLERPAVEVARVIRLGRAYTFDGGRRLRILDAAVRPEVALSPGVLDGILLGCGQGSLELRRVQPEGRAEMAAADWGRGRRHGGPLGTAG